MIVHFGFRLGTNAKLTDIQERENLKLAKKSPCTPNDTVLQRYTGSTLKFLILGNTRAEAYQVTNFCLGESILLF